MNFLAHLHLSGNDEDLLVGNFIADGFKGRSYKALPQGIARGVEVHRFIDSFADQSQASDEARALLRKDVGKLAPIAMDMIFDHFLASKFDEYHSTGLEDYTTWAYAILDRYQQHFMTDTKRMYQYMKEGNWLLNYRTKQGIQRAIMGLSRRKSFASGLSSAVDSLEHNYLELGDHFDHFYPVLQKAVRQHIKAL